jgi:hypothetical protein
MMTRLDAAKSGSFAIAGDLTVHRLGFGAMRLTGRGIWGPPEDPEECRRVLATLPDLGAASGDGPDVRDPSPDTRKAAPNAVKCGRGFSGELSASTVQFFDP